MTFALSTIEQVFPPPFGDASGGGYGITAVITTLFC